jgi:hypothetical protein
VYVCTLLHLLGDEADDLEAAVVLQRNGRGLAGQLLDLLLALPPISLALQPRDEAHGVHDVLHVGLESQIRVLHESLRADDALDVQSALDRQVVGIRDRTPSSSIPAAAAIAAVRAAIHLPLSIEQTVCEHGLTAPVVAEILHVALHASVTAVWHIDAAVHVRRAEAHPHAHPHRHPRVRLHTHRAGALVDRVL